MIEQKKSGIRAVPFRVWLVLLLILWIAMLVGYHNTRAVRRERLRMDVTWTSCEVVLYEYHEGRDPCRYMHLEDIEGFDAKSDDWKPFSGGIVSAVPEDVTEIYADLLLMDKMIAAETGYVLFRDETPREIGSILNFTLAVYDAQKNELYYIEYNS